MEFNQVRARTTEPWRNARRLRIAHPRGHGRTTPTRAASSRATLARIPIDYARLMLEWVDDGPVYRMDVQRPRHLVDEPPCVEAASKGVMVTYPMPNSSQFVFPMIVAPEAFSRWTTVASKGDWKS